jgi:hypothetical protein
MKRRAFLVGAPLALAGCAGGVSVWAPDSAVNAAMYQGTGETSLTLYTMRNIGSGNGAHTSLLVDASQRVMFDPAGSFSSTQIPERDDVLFGMSPQIEEFYVSFHARETYYVEGQRIVVPAAVAEQALRLVMAFGPVGKARCTRAVSTVLSQLPGFFTIKLTYFPIALRDWFQELPDVVLTEYRENDADDKSIAAAQIEDALTQLR